MPPRRSRALLASGAAAGLGVCAWEGTLVQRSPAAHASVLAMIAAALALAVLVGRGRQRAPSADWLRHGLETLHGDLTGRGRRPAALWAGTLLWVALVAATVGWDLNSFAHQAHDLPTLSRLVGDVTRHDWGRALVFAAWLALGTFLVAGGRGTPRRRSGARRRSGEGRAVPAAPAEPAT